MELIINFIVGDIRSVCIGLSTNYIYDKIKNHLYIAKNQGFVLLAIYVSYMTYTIMR
ncbi:hypothetical protein [Clostridium sp. CCUG 7971]|uniref:hypothetical protein n=1 Tax=Clostridium sp. CCUG 7971 TaxID=2811414 RepID=UPI001ABA062D|nr:hypothetical protein [Clostridium sp. CCUG 7971]MBO3444298.1 hypothetical protein [Clostridium sp. CCUG 7971]